MLFVSNLNHHNYPFKVSVNARLNNFYFYFFIIFIYIYIFKSEKSSKSTLVLHNTEVPENQVNIDATLQCTQT